MKINPKSLLFFDFNQAEADEFTKWAQTAVMHNHFEPHPWVVQWFDVACPTLNIDRHDARNLLPTFALLSIVKRQNIEWVADKLEGPLPEPRAPHGTLIDVEQAERNPAVVLAKRLSPEFSRDLAFACQGNHCRLQHGIHLEREGLIARTHNGLCWPTAFGRRVYAWLEIFDKLSPPPEPPTLERVLQILEKAGHPSGGRPLPVAEQEQKLIDRIRAFALDWFAHFTDYVVPDEDVALIRRAIEFQNTHRRWPWELLPSSLTPPLEKAPQQ